MPNKFGFHARAMMVFVFVAAGTACDQAPDPKPDQPVQFSHSQHAADNKIPCMYCHQTADRSPVASIPSMSTCMNCHKFVPGTKQPEEVTKLVAAWEQREPLAWNKVHDVPDFVIFTHKRHVRYFMDCSMERFAAGEADVFDPCGLAPNVRFSRMSAPVSETTEESIALRAQYFACSQCHGPVWEFGTGQRVEPLSMGWCVDCHRARIAIAPPEEQALVHGRMMDCWTCHK